MNTKVSKSILSIILSFGLFLQTGISASVSAQSSQSSTPLRVGKDLTAEQLNAIKASIADDIYDGDTVFAKATPEQLAQFKPSKLNQALRQQWAHLKTTGKMSMEHTIKNLPAETLAFMVALGGLAALKMSLDSTYNANPLGGQQFVEQQLSPVGTLGFGLFMMTQGFTTNFLNLQTQSPLLRSFFPYLGMSAGMFAQTYLTTFLTDPAVTGCVDSMFKRGQHSEDICDQAYDKIAPGNFLWTNAPNLMSMLGSTFVIGLTQNGLRAAALKRGATQLALLMTPGGMHLKGVRWLMYKGVEISLFIEIDELFRKYTTYAWKNIFDSKDLGQRLARLKEAHEQFKTNPSEANAKLFFKEYQGLETAQSDWRNFNLGDGLLAFTSWSQMVSKLLSMYSGSFLFYDEVLRGLKDPELVLKTRPFFGITAEGFRPEDKSGMIARPAFYENAQRSQLSKVTKAWLGKISNLPILSIEKKELEALLMLASSENASNQAKGIKGLADLQINLRRNIVASPTYRPLVNDIMKELGTPEPLLEPGEGFARTIIEASASKESYLKTPFYPNVGIFNTPTIEESLLVQMICGPNTAQRESLIEMRRGFYAEFKAPSIIKDKDGLDAICNRYQGPGLDKKIYNFSFQKNGQYYKGIFDLILKNLNPELMNGPFNQWWENKAKSEMMTAFNNYDQRYNQIQKTIATDLISKTQSKLNETNWANNPLEQISQDLTLQLGLLESFSIKLKYSEIRGNFGKQLNVIRQLSAATKKGLDVKEARQLLEAHKALIAEFDTLLTLSDENSNLAHVVKPILERTKSLSQELLSYQSMFTLTNWNLNKI